MSENPNVIKDVDTFMGLFLESVLLARDNEDSVGYFFGEVLVKLLVEEIETPKNDGYQDWIHGWVIENNIEIITHRLAEFFKELNEVGGVDPTVFRERMTGGVERSLDFVEVERHRLFLPSTMREFMADNSGWDGIDILNYSKTLNEVLGFKMFSILKERMIALAKGATMEEVMKEDD